MTEFVEEHVPADADGQVRRAASRLGMIAAAGELAVAFNIVPWSEGRPRPLPRRRSRTGSGAAAALSRPRSGRASPRSASFSRPTATHGSSRWATSRLARRQPCRLAQGPRQRACVAGAPRVLEKRGLCRAGPGGDRPGVGGARHASTRSSGQVPANGAHPRQPAAYPGLRRVADHFRGRLRCMSRPAICWPPFALPKLARKLVLQVLRAAFHRVVAARCTARITQARQK